MPEKDLKTIFSEILTQMQDLPDKQQRILSASLDLFSEKGFSQTTTADIAQRAQVAQGTVYRRFKNKQDLLTAVLMPILTDAFPQAVDEFAGQNLNRDYESLDQMLREIVLDRLTFIQANRKVLKIILTQVLVDEKMLALLKDRFLAAIMRQTQASIKKLQAKKQLIDWPPARILSLIAGSIFTVAVRILLFPEEKIDLKTESDYLVSFLKKALANS